MEAIFAVFSDYTFQIAAIGSALLGIISGVLGSFAVLRKQSLIGDAVSHSALPGVVAAFMITQTKNTEVLLLGALISGTLAALIILGIVRTTRVKFDSALALILSVFFGLGLVLRSFLQNVPNAQQAGLDRFIFGQASTMLFRDIIIMLISGTVLLVLTAVFWKEFKIFSFDPDYAQSIGFSPKRLGLVLSFMTVAATIIGLQTVGAILMSAMLIAPGVAARQWTNKLSVMVVLAAAFGAVSGIGGALISSMVANMPTGPTIVLVVSVIVLVSITLAPNRGLIHRLYVRRKARNNLKEAHLNAHPHQR